MTMLTELLDDGRQKDKAEYYREHLKQSASWEWWVWACALIAFGGAVASLGLLFKEVIRILETIAMLGFLAQEDKVGLPLCVITFIWLFIGSIFLAKYTLLAYKGLRYRVQLSNEDIFSLRTKQITALSSIVNCIILFVVSIFVLIIFVG